MKYIRLFVIFTVCVLPLCGFSQSQKISRDAYILKYKELATKQMKEYGIPASIILAQGCLESDNGNSRLATQANNHFGIKCQQVWTGEKIYHDDDAPQECFRKYPSAVDSYEDHSLFLRYRDRYSFLFDLPPTDYKAWAAGLKKAGYATNPQYAELLIRIIEENQLYQYDTNVEVEIIPPSRMEIDIIVEKPLITTNIPNRVNLENYTFELERQEFKRNDVRFIKARSNDTYTNIAREYNIDLKKLLTYNDLTNTTALLREQVVFLGAKKKRADNKHPVHIAEAGEKLYDISQRYAVQLKSLCRYNNMNAHETLQDGQEVYLREPKVRRR